MKKRFLKKNPLRLCPGKQLALGALLVLGAGLLPLPLGASTSSGTVPSGYITYTVPGGSVAASKMITFSLPVRRVATNVAWVSAGKISGFTNTSLTSTGANWPSGQLSLTGSPYFVRIKNGADQGRTYLITGNTTDTLTLASGNLGSLALQTSGVSQSTFEIFPGDTLMSFFGPGTADGAGGTILGAGNANDADRVRVHDGVGWKDYYYNTTNNRWQDSANNKNDLVLLPHWGINYTRKAATPVTFTIPGTVTDTNTVLNIAGSGVTYFALQFPADITLFDTGIHLKPGFVADTGTPSLADKVYFWNGTAWVYYIYNQAAGQWRDGSTTTNRNTMNIPAGTPFWFQKTTAATAQTWNFTPPYNLGSL